MISTITAAVRDHDADADGLVHLLLLVIGVLCIAGGAWRAYLRDFPVAVVLLVIGLVVLFVAA